MIAHHAETDKAQALSPLVDDLVAYVQQAAQHGTPAHEVERALWTRILDLDRQALGLFFRLQGTGDLGQAIPLPDGQAARRLDQTHAWDYRSVFGDFTLYRTAYGTREGQKIAFLPLDARLQLPKSDYSYQLRQWDAALGCEAAFARVGATSGRPGVEAVHRQPGAAQPPHGRAGRPLPAVPAAVGVARGGGGAGGPGRRQGRGHPPHGRPGTATEGATTCTW